MIRETPRELWPVDRLMLIYLFAVSLVLAGFAHRIDNAGWLLLAHAVAIALVVAYAFVPRLPGAYFFRLLYPLPYVFACYRMMSVLIRATREARFDALLSAWDFAIWRAHPAVWLQRIQFPLLTELMQIIYALFVPVVLAIAVIQWIRNREEFRSYAFLLTLGFLVSYAMYFVVPARGPRFFLDTLFTQPLRGLWLFAPLRSGLDTLESAHYDCFPSGHAEMVILAWWTARSISRRLSNFCLVYLALMLLATVYLRYHYTVDLLAGVCVAGLVLYTAPYLQTASVGRERQFQDEPARDFASTKQR